MGSNCGNDRPASANDQDVPQFERCVGNETDAVICMAESVVFTDQYSTGSLYKFLKLT